MNSTWNDSTSNLKYLPHILWILFVGTLGIVVGQNIIGWAIAAFIAFVIYPKFWKDREERGKLGLVGFRTVMLWLCVFYTLFITYATWQRFGEPMPFVGVEAKAAVADSLRDPSSAEFREVFEGPTATCGEVNGKNAYGAYAGFKRFVYADGIARVEPEQPVVFAVDTQTAYYREVAEFARTSRRCYE